MENQKFEYRFNLHRVYRKMTVIFLVGLYALFFPKLVELILQKQLDVKSLSYMSVMTFAVLFILANGLVMALKNKNSHADQPNFLTIKNNNLELSDSSGKSITAAEVKSLKFDFYDDGSDNNPIIGYLGPILEITGNNFSYKIGTLSKGFVWTDSKKLKILIGPDYKLMPWDFHKLLRLLDLENKLRPSKDGKLDFIDKPDLISYFGNQITSYWKIFLFGAVVAAVATVCIESLLGTPAGRFKIAEFTNIK